MTTKPFAWSTITTAGIWLVASITAAETGQDGWEKAALLATFAIWGFAALGGLEERPFIISRGPGLDKQDPRTHTKGGSSSAAPPLPQECPGMPARVKDDKPARRTAVIGCDKDGKCLNCGKAFCTCRCVE